MENAFWLSQHLQQITIHCGFFKHTMGIFKNFLLLLLFFNSGSQQLSVDRKWNFPKPWLTAWHHVLTCWQIHKKSTVKTSQSALSAKLGCADQKCVTLHTSIRALSDVRPNTRLTTAVTSSAISHDSLRPREWSPKIWSWYSKPLLARPWSPLLPTLPL